MGRRKRGRAARQTTSKDAEMRRGEGRAVCEICVQTFGWHVIVYSDLGLTCQCWA